MLSLVLDKDMHVIGRHKQIIASKRDNDVISQSIVECINTSLHNANVDRKQLAGIGCASAGIVDIAKGSIEFTPNLNLANLNLRDMLKREFDVPVLLENDANAGIYGEFIHGVAQGYQNVIGVFIGTGVGGGIIVDGRLYVGSSGCAAEIGHMVVHPHGPRCSCGKYGCLEAFVARRAIAKELISLAAMGKAQTILNISGTDIRKVKSGVILAAIQAGERATIEIVEHSAHYLGIGLANCISIFNPELIVLGGGLIEKLGDWYIPKAESSMRAHALPALAERVTVVKGTLGDDAVAFGAVALLKENL